MTGIDKGKAILRNIPQVDAPSICADSSNSFGSCWKNVRKIIIYHTRTSVGIIMTQKLLYNPIPLIKINVGIKPPLKNIVNKQKNIVNKQKIIKYFLPINSFFDKPYASIAVTNTDMAVPTTVRRIDIKKALTNRLSLKTTS